MNAFVTLRLVLRATAAVLLLARGLPLGHSNILSQIS